MIPRREIIQPESRVQPDMRVSNNEGVGDPPKSILFQILFEICLCSFVEQRGVEPPRGVWMCYGHECRAT